MKSKMYRIKIKIKMPDKRNDTEYENVVDKKEELDNENQQLQVKPIISNI